MTIKNRLVKLEGTLPPSTICRCPDAVMYVGTEWAKTCYRCDKTIDMKTWGSWDVLHPVENKETGEWEGPDFAMARNDQKEDRKYKFHSGGEAYW